MKLTSANLHQCATYKGRGFTKAQLRLLGVSWPPKAGWLKRLVGKTIPDDVYGKVYRMGQQNSEKLSEKAYSRRKQGQGKFKPLSVRTNDLELIKTLERTIQRLEQRNQALEARRTVVGQDDKISKALWNFEKNIHTNNQETCIDRI